MRHEETPETPETNEPEDTLSLKADLESLKHDLDNIVGKLKIRTKRWYEKFSPTSWISVCLGILLIATIIHYEGREDRYRYSTFAATRPMYRLSTDTTGLDRQISDMRSEMDDLRQQHAEAMDQVRNSFFEREDAPMAPTYADSQTVYNNFYSVDGWQYSISSTNDTLTGTVTSKDTKRIKDTMTKLQGIGLTVDQKGDSLTFSGRADTVDAVQKILK